jgi:hypothetical protein
VAIGEEQKEQHRLALSFHRAALYADEKGMRELMDSLK